MRKALVALALAGLAVPALAGVTEGEWKESRFTELWDWTYDAEGVRFSNCHMVRLDLGDLQAVPKCYALNRGTKSARVRVRFVALDKAGAPVVDTTLTYPSDLQSAVGAELVQHVPITAEEWARIDRARVRPWASTK